MKPRILFAVAVVVLACGIALWLWPAGVESVARRKDTQHTNGPAASTPSTDGGSTRQAVARQTPESVSASPAPTPPIRYTSAVMPGQPVARSTPQQTAAKAPIRTTTARAKPPEPEPEGRRELEDVRSMFMNYRARLGENPVGNNAEIMKAVMGENRQRLNLGPPHDQSLNQNGELVDRWGHPYFFHQLSKDEMEIRSAGPDGQFGTSDDQSTR